MSELPPSAHIINIGESPIITLESKQGYTDVREDAMTEPKICSGDLGDADTWEDLQVCRY